MSSEAKAKLLSQKTTQYAQLMCSKRVVGILNTKILIHLSLLLLLYLSLYLNSIKQSILSVSCQPT